MNSLRQCPRDKYNLDGNQSKKTDNTGRVTEYEYDHAGRLASEAESYANSLVYGKAYTYDAADNPKLYDMS